MNVNAVNICKGDLTTGINDNQYWSCRGFVRYVYEKKLNMTLAQCYKYII